MYVGEEEECPLPCKKSGCGNVVWLYLLHQPVSHLILAKPVCWCPLVASVATPPSPPPIQTDMNNTRQANSENTHTNKQELRRLLSPLSWASNHAMRTKYPVDCSAKFNIQNKYKKNSNEIAKLKCIEN